jgi:phosphoribosylamine---glycine ligase
MKIALSSYSGIGAWWVLRLMAEGHKVDYFLSKPEYEDVLSGLIPKPKGVDIDYRRHIEGYGHPSYKGYDLSLFDLTGRPKQADASRAEVPTLGDGSFEELLEDDREAGIKAMEDAGIEVPPYQMFENVSEAKAFIKKTDKRYVFKPYEGKDGSDKAVTYVAKDAEDMLKNIDKLFELAKHHHFLLQEFIKGTEASVMGYFNGTDFFQLTCTLECKKFMNDDKGPNTGAAGNLVFAISDESMLYEKGLKKIIPILQMSGFKGMIDLNTIITLDKAYGLEWTPRFGYIADSTIAAMYGDGFGDMLHAIASGKTPEIKWTEPYGFGVTISIPPYPTEIRMAKAKDIAMEGIDPTDVEQLKSIFLYDIMLTPNKKELVTSGNYGYIGAPNGIGDSIEQAVARCNALIDRIHIPNMQYRTDIEKNTRKRYDFLEQNGWL